jgi:hypothetical protein
MFPPDVQQDVYDTVDKQFESLMGKADKFLGTTQVVDPTEYEYNNTPLAPTGWVENADPDLDGEASVALGSSSSRVACTTLSLVLEHLT